ncbi:MAG TPA: hypothetical protein PKD86_02465 [Gemmatales bacterium]|nr:hypothetical protein [Gemmatales bacterium]HMP58194.1 hypothetical protein [Gemmatales bacterium]
MKSQSGKSWARAGALALALACSATGHAAAADPITIVNAGFEDTTGGIPFNEFTFGAPFGWSLYDPFNITGGGTGPVYWVGTLQPTPPTFFTTGAPEGTRVGIAFNFFGSGNQGEYGLEQTLTDVLLPNSLYTLTVEIGNIASGTALNGDFFNLDGFPGYRVDLLAGGVVLASDNNSLAGLIPEGEFVTSSFAFETGGFHPQLGQALGIRLVNLNVVDSAFPLADLEVDFDDVRLTVTAIPEPTTLALLSVTGLYWLRRSGRRLPELDGD